MFIRISASLPLAIIAVMSSACAPAMKELRLNQAQLTTPSMVCTAASDSVSVPGHVATSKSSCEQEFRLKYEQIRGNTAVGVAQANAQAAAFLLYAQRAGYLNGFNGGYGSGAPGTYQPYNGGRPVQCAWPGC